MDTQDLLGHPYQPRVIDPLVVESLASAGAVLIEGPRGSGKTMTATNAAASCAMLDDPVTADIVRVAPEAVLEGARPRLLDEWQLMPQLWNLVRRAVDASSEKGQFLLTGSATPADDVTRHTGAARVMRIQQRTLTWFEQDGLPTSTGVSLSDLFDGGVPTPDLSQPLTYSDVLGRLLRPGFPGLRDLPPQRSQRMLRSYLDDVARVDMPRLIDMRHDPIVMRQLLNSLARSVASEVSYSTLAADVRQVAPTITPDTVATYTGVLEQLFVLEPQKAWAPALRSRARLRSSVRQHLADPALAAAALGASKESLSRDPATVGLLFESAVIHDLRILSASLEAEVRHYRDSNGHEIDAVVTLPDGRWGAIEIKLGAGQIGEGRLSLAKAISQIDSTVVSQPAFRMVVTGTGQTYVCDDGTVTCPLTALRP